MSGESKRGHEVQPKTRPRQPIVFLILGALMTVNPFSIDMYLPAFPQMAHDFGATPASIALTISSYFIGLAAGQLFYGPLLDRFGRKKPLYAGLVVYIFSCLGCIGSSSLQAMIVWRLIQSLGGGVAFVSTLAMVRDFFPVEESARILSLLMLILGISPLLAPTVGGFITAWLNWHWVFILLAIIVFLILILCFFFLPEAHRPDPTVSLRPASILNVFAHILKNRKFSTYAFAGAFSFATMFVYVAGSPMIFMNIFRVSPQLYGGIFALLSVSFIGGNQLNILILRKYKSIQIFKAALICQAIASGLFLLGAMNHWYGLAGTITMFFVCLGCLGLTYPNASAIALAPFSKNAGSASALVGFLQIGVAALASSSVGFFSTVDHVPIITLLLSSSLIALLILLAGTTKAQALQNE